MSAPARGAVIPFEDSHVPPPDRPVDPRIRDRLRIRCTQGPRDRTIAAGPAPERASIAMNGARPVYIGTDSGATTSKVGGVWDDGTTISTRVLQHPTDAQLGPQAVVRGWVETIDEYLRDHDLTWDQVH